MEIGKKIREERKKLKLTFKELSNLTNIPISTLQSYEDGTVKNISHDRLSLLAKIFKKDLNYFYSIYDNSIAKKDFDILINNLSKEYIINTNKSLLDMTNLTEKEKEKTIDAIIKILNENLL